MAFVAVLAAGVLLYHAHKKASSPLRAQLERNDLLKPRLADVSAAVSPSGLLANSTVGAMRGRRLLAASETAVYDPSLRFGLGYRYTVGQ